MFNAHALGHGGHTPVDFRLWRLLDGQREGQVFPDAQVRKDGVILKYESNAAVLQSLGGGWLSVEQQVARRGRFDSRHHVHGRCLAAARRTEQRQEFAIGNFQVEVAHGGEITKAFGDVAK